MRGRIARCASMMLSLQLLILWLIGCALSSASAEEPPNANAGQSTCYKLGLETAKDDYSSQGAFWGGLAAGTALGPLGYGIGLITLNNWEVEPAPNPTGSTCGRDKERFAAGYHDYVIEERGRRFRNGALLGTLVFVTWVSLSIKVLD